MGCDSGTSGQHRRHGLGYFLFSNRSVNFTTLLFKQSEHNAGLCQVQALCIFLNCPIVEEINAEIRGKFTKVIKI